MNKYIFWSVMLSAIFFNALCVNASEFIIITKDVFYGFKKLLKEEGAKITDVRPLDMEPDGLLLIVFE